jgi:hypothetical protein
VRRRGPKSFLSKQKTGEKMATLTATQARPIPRELRAVLRIFTADDELKRKTFPHVNLNRTSIDWPAIWSSDFGGGHAAVLTFAQAIWCDQVVTKADPFDRAFAMDNKLKQACLEALAIRWGLMTGDERMG